MISLADLDVTTAVQRVNQDSGYRPAGAVAAYRESTSWQRRLPSSTVCEGSIS